MQDHSNSIAGFLDAYHPEDVRKALRIYSAKKRGDRKAFEERIISEELTWTDIGAAPPTPEMIESFFEKKLDWRVVNGRVQTRMGLVGVQRQDQTSTSITADDSVYTKKKADLSMQQTDKICITCGGTLAYEPICGGCRLGRIGFKGRYVCMEDMDHEFYVLREGIILPNQGD